MTDTKVQLPKINYSFYELILKSLRYYLYSCTEFVLDDIKIMGICEMIDYLEGTRKIENAEIQLPKMSHSSYQLIIQALKYYVKASTDLVIEPDISIQIFELLNSMEKEKQIVKG